MANSLNKFSKIKKIYLNFQQDNIKDKFNLELWDETEGKTERYNNLKKEMDQKLDKFLLKILDIK